MIWFNYVTVFNLLFCFGFTGSDEGVYAWVVANYALGTLGGDPLETTGIIELGGASAQVRLHFFLITYDKKFHFGYIQVISIRNYSQFERNCLRSFNFEVYILDKDLHIWKHDK